MIREGWGLWVCLVCAFLRRGGGGAELFSLGSRARMCGNGSKLCLG